MLPLVVGQLFGSEIYSNSIKMKVDPEIELIKNDGDVLSQDAWYSWYEKFKITSKHNYYFFHDELLFSSQPRALEHSLIKLGSVVSFKVFQELKNQIDEIKEETGNSSFVNYYEDTKQKISVKSKASFGELYKRIYIDVNGKYKAFVCIHKSDYEKIKKKEIENIVLTSKNYLKDFEKELNKNNFTSAFKNLCEGYALTENSIYILEKPILNFNNKFTNKITKFLQNVKPIVNFINDEKLPFSQYNEFVNINYKYKTKPLENFPFKLECEGCLVKDWINQRVKSISTNLNGYLREDIKEFLTTSNNQKITIYPDYEKMVIQQDEDFNKEMFNTFNNLIEKKIEFDVSSKIIVDYIYIKNNSSTNYLDYMENKDKIEKLLEKIDNIEMNDEVKIQGPFINKDRRLNLIFNNNPERKHSQSEYIAELSYTIDGFEKCKVFEKIINPEDNQDKFIKQLLDKLYNEYNYKNKFVEINFDLAENTLVYIEPNYFKKSNSNRPIESPISGKQSVLVKRGQKYNYRFWYKSLFGEKEFHSVLNKYFTKDGDFPAGEVDKNYSFQKKQISLPIKIQGDFGNYQVLVESKSKHNLPFFDKRWGWTKDSLIKINNINEDLVHFNIFNYKKYKLSLLKNGYKKHPKLSKLNFHINNYNKNNNIAETIVLDLESLKPNFIDYFSYYSFPGRAQKKIIHKSKFNWRKIESYLLTGLSLYYGYNTYTSFEKYYKHKDKYLTLQQEYLSLPEDVSQEERDNLSNIAQYEYNLMSNYNADVISNSSILLSVYVFNLFDIIFTLNIQN